MPSAAQDLLHWYHRNARDLPWRRPPHLGDAYATWVSEVMLQQTRVGVVVPYYERFMARFPTVSALAAAELESVLGLWSGLGYYRRARQLHAAARQIVSSGGGLPRTVAQWRELPGIGDYTAAAIASIACGAEAVALDTNVQRVLARRSRLAERPASAAGRTRMLAAAAELFTPGEAGSCNQALMELGAQICTPQQPDCDRCPVSVGCSGHHAGDAGHYPLRQPRRAAVSERRVAAIVGRPAGDRGSGAEGPRILLVCRSAQSPALADTWELPWTEAAPGAAEALAARYGGRWSLGPSLGKVRHQITFRRIELEVRQAELGGSGEVAEGIAAGWFSPEQIASLPRSSLLAKALAVAARSAGFARASK